jgi:hypothetical protein
VAFPILEVFMEIIFGFIVMGLTIVTIRFIEKIIIRSKNPIVILFVMAVGTACAISLTKDAAKWLRKDDK